MEKSYYGKCGFCKYCNLASGRTYCYSTSFQCTKNGYTVKADENPCNKFEQDNSRSNSMIASFDK